MSEIEVGEYVRLNSGKIGKVTFIEKGSIMLDIESNRWVGLCCIKSHSKNIIDLIEEGDYVNGYKVDDIENEKLVIGNTTQVVEQILGNNKDIESILTHEQYEENIYKVGDIE